MFRLTLLILASSFLWARSHDANYVPLKPEVRMPDGTTFLTWRDETQYTKTYHVDRNNQLASDQNAGTAERPFRTINRAAQVVRAGERVWVHSGVYREMVQPGNGGEGPNRMIAYEAAPGEQVIIKGSRVLTARWQLSKDPSGKAVPFLFSKRLWMATLPDEIFEPGYQAFGTPNASPEELDLMPWAVAWKGRPPYSLPRGLIFQNDRRMSQLVAYEDLVRIPGSYWVARDGKTVHIHPFGDDDPNESFFECAVQSHIFKPQRQGLGFIRVSGFIMEHCANGFPRVGVGALNAMGGHHWIIEHNTVRQINSVGIEFGYYTTEPEDKRQPPRRDPDIGHMIVRDNRIADCGAAGIRSFVVSYGLVEDNDVIDCGWQDAEFHWETAGIKLLINNGTLVRNNHIARMEGGGGIWLDWNNRNSRVTGNFIHDVRTAQGAIFVEASQHPNLVDENVIWKIDGQGVRAADTDCLVIAQNLFGRVKGEIVFAKVATDRSLGGRKLTSTQNRVINNIVVDAGLPIAFDPGNSADYNVYVSTSDTREMQPLASEEHSSSIKAEVSVDEPNQLLTWKPAKPLPVVPRLAECTRDFSGRYRTAESNVPGPFLALAHAASVLLKNGSPNVAQK